MMENHHRIHWGIIFIIQVLLLDQNFPVVHKNNKKNRLILMIFPILFILIKSLINWLLPRTNFPKNYRNIKMKFIIIVKSINSKKIMIKVNFK